MSPTKRTLVGAECDLSYIYFCCTYEWVEPKINIAVSGKTSALSCITPSYYYVIVNKLITIWLLTVIQGQSSPKIYVFRTIIKAISLFLGWFWGQWHTVCHGARQGGGHVWEVWPFLDPYMGPEDIWRTGPKSNNIQEILQCYTRTAASEIQIGGWGLV